MVTAVFQELDGDIACIDALYTAPDIACCYLVGSAGEYALIETGTPRSVDNIIASLDALGVRCTQLRYIIPTHVHLDHAGGAGSLMARCPDAQLLIHPRGARHMIDPARLIESARQVYGPEVFARLYGDIVPVDPARLRELRDGETLNLGRRRLTVRHTQGHADHHLCLFDHDSQGWFSGDMFGASYKRQRYERGSFLMPATTPTQFDPARYADSVRALAAAAPRWFFLTHFGALPFEQGQVHGLTRQLARYAELGETYRGGLDALVQQVKAVTEAELRRFLPADAAAREAESLDMDVRLNAQGIAWWRQQRDRKAAQSQSAQQ
jgi:glyoxylase-like metal-dependent hydrolase (beta-lactamase superfamily II)